MRNFHLAGRSTFHSQNAMVATSHPLAALTAIVEDGILVHEGVRSAYARWRSHALSQLALDRTWYARMRDGYLAKLAEGAGR